MTALLTYSQWFTAEPSVANGACNGFSMTAWGYSRLRRASIRSGDVCYVLDCVAKLSLRLRLNRDSVDQDYDSRGTVDDGSAGSRARSILLFV